MTMTRVLTSEPDDPQNNRVLFFCPGCQGYHGVRTHGPREQGPVWGWNGSLERPTFTPSILVRSGPGMREVCHSFVTDGQIQFLGDCTHALAGQTVPIPEET